MSSDRPRLEMAPCTHQAALYAVERWHYSRCRPAGRLVQFGAWEDGRYVGCVLFGHGASPQIGRPYGLEQSEVCELVRMAMTDHATPTSRVVAIALKLLRKANPGLRLVVSYADSEQGHRGVIYQAGGWVYTGESFSSNVRINGRVRHNRSIRCFYGTTSVAWLREHVDPDAEIVHCQAKYKYLMPLDEEMRRQVEKLRKPYPRRAGSDTGDTPAAPGGRGGSSPTPALGKVCLR